MVRKKIVMFYGKENNFNEDPFEDKGDKKGVFYHFFQEGCKRRFDMYLVMGLKKYLGGLNFKHPLFFNPASDEFELLNITIKADAILDRSGGTDFPPSNIDKKVLDNRKFKLICWNKVLMYEYLGGFSPPSYRIGNFEEMKKALKYFKEKELAVLKPARGMKGKDVRIDYPSKLLRQRNIDFDKNWVLQKYIDTSKGIKGLAQGKHDLRIVIVNGEIVFSHVRQPLPYRNIANVAQGGSIREIAIKEIPKKIIEKAKRLQKKIDADFDKPLYSIDFGIQNEKPSVFEINDTIGFPSEKMGCYKKFIKNVLDALAIRAGR